MLSTVLALASILIVGDVVRADAGRTRGHRPRELLFATTDETFAVNEAFVAATREIRAEVHETITLGDGEVIAVTLEPFAVVAESAMVQRGHGPLAQTDAELAAALRGVTHLRGAVVGEPGSLVYLAAGTTGVAGIIDRGPGRGRYALRQADGESRGLLTGPVRFDPAGGTSQPEVPLCGSGLLDDLAGGVAGAGAVPPGVRPCIEVAVDSDFDFHNIFGDDLAATEYVAALYGAISSIYLRDTGAIVRVVFLRLMPDPKDLFNEPDPLYEFRDWWNENMADVERDLAQLLTGRRNLPYGGVAWLSAACSESGYSVNGYLIGGFADPYVPHPGNWDIIVVAHELGHNVGTLHTHSYDLDSCNQGEVQRGSIMSYCHINSGATANIDMRFHRVCSDEIESYLMETPCIGSDCDGDEIDDGEAIAQGLVADTNGDGIPDSCQDCDADGVPDPIAIANGDVQDVDADGRPDSCEPDCNGNGVPDSHDIAMGTSTDEYGDGIPDECEPDCDGNGSSDYSDIQADMALDRGRDAIIDECQDCDGDGIDDFAELNGSASIWVGNAAAFEVRELHPRSGVAMNVVPLDAAVYDLVIGPDGYLYASAGRAIWRIDRIARAALNKAFEFPQAMQARGLAFRADGTLLVAVSSGGIFKIDVANGTSMGSFAAPAASDPRDVYVRPNGNVLVSYGSGHVWQFGDDGTPIGAFAELAPHLADFHGMFELPNGDGVLVVSRAQRLILRFDADTGEPLGQFDVQPGSMLMTPWGLAPSADGRAVLAPSATSGSTVNGYNLDTGYLERTYRVYPADAPNANAIVVAPYSATDLNGNLVPDECETMSPDLNGDGIVDGADLAIMLGGWGTAFADLNGDGTTNGADLAILLGAWGAKG